MSIAHVPLSVSDDEDDLIAETFKIIKFLFPHWEMSNTEHLLFTQGITNKLVGWFKKDEKNEQDEWMKIVKVYGKKRELFIDFETEPNNLQLLNRNSYPPRLLATFNNGIVYCYVPGETVNIEMYYNLSFISLVPVLLAKIHKLSVNEDIPNIPSYVSGINLFLRNLPDKEDSQYSNHTSRVLNNIPGGKKLFVEEYNFIREKLKDVQLPLVFCHNDLLLGNIIYNKGKISFIDYEYGGHNYQAFDIANHFAEFAGVNEFNPNNYPSEEYKREWLTNYLKAYLADGLPQSDKDFAENLNHLYYHVELFTPVIHFFWSLWGVIQSYYSPINFDYLSYAVLKLNEYQKFKNRLHQQNGV